VDTVTQHQDASQRTSVSEIAIQATMLNFALRRRCQRPLLHQLQLHQLQRPRRLDSALTVPVPVYVVTIVTTIAIVDTVTRHQDASQRTSVSEVAIQATMLNFALRRQRPLPHQLQLQAHRPRPLQQGTSPARTQELKLKLVVTTAMMTAIAAVATQSPAA